MKKKLFEKLKQEYASLGLGDEFLQAQADTLVGYGFVTDENIEGVVTSLKAFLEGVQKTNDRRVTEAVKKANDAAAQKAADADKAAQAKKEELLRKIAALQEQLDKQSLNTSDDKSKSGDDDFQKKFAAANAETMAQMKSLQETVKTLKDVSERQTSVVKQLQEEKENLEKQQAADRRQAKIIAKAQELKIPQWRIDEGFAIGAEASDEEISTFLTKVSGNITNNILPTNVPFSIAEKDVSQNEVDAIAEKIVSQVI